MKSPYDPPEDDSLPPPPSNQPTSKLIISILALAAISVCWRFLSESSLSGSGLLYIALPTTLAIFLAHLPNPDSHTGRIMKGITLFLLLTGILLIEGLICILIVSPLFYLIGAIVGSFCEGYRKSKKNTLNCSMIALLFLFSFEGINDTLSFNRHEEVTVTQHLKLTPEQARAAIANGPQFDLSELPLFLKAGFPTPQNISGEGITKGAQWSISMTGKNGQQALTVEVSSASESQIVFHCIQNETKIGDWMNIEKVIWNLSPTPDGTLVSMTFHYQRLLDPAWYFKPIQRYGISKAGDYFLSQTFRE